MSLLKNKKNIIFDLGNVVVDINLNNCVKAFKKLGYKGDGNFLNTYKQTGVFGDLEVGKIGQAEFTANIRKLLKSDVTDEEIITAWNAIILDYKHERIEAILELKKSYNVFLLSNTNKIHIDYCGNKVPLAGSLDNLFHKTYYSHEMGKCKPNKDIFEELLADAGIKANETVFFDDSPANVAAAKELDIDSYIVEYPDQWLEMLETVQ